MAYFPGLDDEDEQRKRKQAIAGQIFAANAELQLRDIGSVLLRERRRVLRVAGIVGLVVVVGALFVPPIYTAQSTMLLKLGREFTYRSEVSDAEPGRSFSLKELINSEVEILDSRELAEEVVREIGVATLYPDIAEEERDDPQLAFAKAVQTFRDHVSARSVLESSVLKVSFSHPDRQLVAAATNLFVERFKDKHLEIFGEDRSVFLEGELERYRQELAAANEAVETFKQEHTIYDAAAQRAMLVAEYAEIDTVYRDLRLRIAQLESGGLGPDQKRVGLGTDPREERRPLEEAYVRLLDLRQREQEQLVGYTETSRTVQGVRSEIQAVEQFILDLQDQELSGLRAQEGILQARRAKLDDEIRTLDQQGRQLEELTRNVAAIESILLTYRQRYEEARISESLDRQRRVNLKVIERALPPLGPSSMSRKLKILLGLGAGAIAGVSVVLLRELTRRR